MQRSTAWTLALKAAAALHAARCAYQLSFGELLLFGSLARKRRGEVGDVDLLILQSNNTQACTCDAYYGDEDFPLPPLPADWSLYYGCDSHLAKRTLHTLIFPVAVLTDQATQEAIAGRQSDSRFLRNCFSVMQRYDCQRRRFVPISYAYFEHQYAARLPGLS